MIPILDLKQQYKDMQKNLDKAVLDVMQSGNYILGKNISALEEEVACYCESEYAIGVASGTDALHLALRALDIGPGDEVITVSFTFVATVEVIALTGATPVFIEVDENTFNLDHKELEKKITPKTKAIIPVHLYGQPVNMSPLLRIAQKYDLYVIEDCAQAIGSVYKGKKVGSLGDMGCFSFFPTKNLGCFGDGGLITTNSDYLAGKLKLLRNHGSKTRYYHEEIGLNSRLDEIQAAILRVKLPYLDGWNKRRREVANCYNTLLSDVEEVIVPCELDDTYCIYNQYTIKVPNRDKINDYLREKGIMSMIYYPVPLHLQEAYSYLGYNKGDFAITEALSNVVLSLPNFPEITKKQQDTVIKTLKDALAKNKSSSLK